MSTDAEVPDFIQRYVQELPDGGASRGGKSRPGYFLDRPALPPENSGETNIASPKRINYLWRRIGVGLFATGMLLGSILHGHGGESKPVTREKTEVNSLGDQAMLNTCVEVVFHKGDTIESQAMRLAGVHGGLSEAKRDDINAVLGYERIIAEQLAMQGITDSKKIPPETTTEVCQDIRID